MLLHHWALAFALTQTALVKSVNKTVTLLSSIDRSLVDTCDFFFCKEIEMNEFHHNSATLSHKYSDVVLLGHQVSEEVE